MAVVKYKSRTISICMRAGRPTVDFFASCACSSSLSGLWLIATPWQERVKSLSQGECLALWYTTFLQLTPSAFANNDGEQLMVGASRGLLFPISSWPLTANRTKGGEDGVSPAPLTQEKQRRHRVNSFTAMPNSKEYGQRKLRRTTLLAGSIYALSLSFLS
jgi:hypothetical protein